MSSNRYFKYSNNLFSKDDVVDTNVYYRYDEPNPNLLLFLKDNCTIYDGNNDGYETSETTESIKSTKETPMYMMHPYWSKKPHGGVEAYIKHFTKPGDMVLDPFCGSGGTGYVSIVNNRNAILLDLSPAATHIAWFHVLPCKIDEFHDLWTKIYEQAFDKLAFLYSAPSISGDDIWINDIIWSEPLQCIKCLNYFHLSHPKYPNINYCPHCNEMINTRRKGNVYGKPVPLWVEAKQQKTDKRQTIIIDEDYRLRKYIEDTINFTSRILPFDWLNKRSIPSELMAGRLGTTGVKTAEDLFNSRAAYAVYTLRDLIENTETSAVMKQRLHFIVTGFLMLATNMRRLTTHGFSGPAGAYYVPPIRGEINVLRIFRKKAELYERCLIQINEANSKGAMGIISCQSADRMFPLKDNSVDYIFTDPPYADKMPYGALNIIWEAYLGSTTKAKGKEVKLENWHDIMLNSFKECYRVLKPNRWMTVCYHDTSEGTWQILKDVVAEAGFITGTNSLVLSIDSGSRSYQQTNADKVVKRDLVVNFRKPTKCEEGYPIKYYEHSDYIEFNQAVIKIIKEYLINNPGVSKDRIYDQVISKLFREGNIEPFNFDSLLVLVADEVKGPVQKRDSVNNTIHEVSHWYIKESDLVQEDESEIAQEDAAAKKLEQFMKKWLKDNPHREGVHYSDLFEYYIYAVKEKPRRQLIDWLPDYFYKTLEGTYRLPGSEEERRAKEEARRSGNNRRIKRYVSYLENGLPVPEKERASDATLAEWIRACKRSGMYTQGKYLYEQGGLNLDKLSEEASVNVEEDYLVCVRSLSREQADQKQNKRTRKKGGA